MFTGWHTVATIAFIALGLVAFVEPIVAGRGAAIPLGWSLTIGGICHFVTAFQGGAPRQRPWQCPITHWRPAVLTGTVFMFGGFYMLWRRQLAPDTLTLLLGAVIFAAGIFEIISYFRRRPGRSSGWVLFNGIVAVLLSAFIWFHWPSSSVWALGTLLGVNLVSTGVTKLMLALAARSPVQHAQA